MSSKLSLLMRGSTFRVLQTLVSIGIGFAMMPFLIGELGKELYGLWVVVGSVVGTYYLLDLGFSQAVTRFVTKYIHQQRYDDANKIINTALVIYSALGLLVLTVSIGFAFFGAENLLDNSDQVGLVQVLLIVGGLQLALEFPAKAFPGVIGSYMRFDWIAKIRTLKTISDAVLIYTFLSNGYGLIAMACIGFVTGCISTTAYVLIVKHLFRQLKYGLEYVDLPTFKGVYSFSKWVFVLDLCATLRGKMDLWLIAFFLGNEVITVYYVAVRLVDYAIDLLAQATNMTTPIFTEYYAKSQWDELKISLQRFIKLDFALAGIAIAGFYLVGQQFITFWMGADFPVTEAWSCLIVLAIGRMSIYVTLPLQCILFAFNKHKYGTLISLAEVVVITALCFWLVPLYGAIGAAIGVSVPTVVGRLLVTSLLVESIFKFIDLELLARLAIFSAGLFSSIYMLWGLVSFGDNLITSALYQIGTLVFLAIGISVLLTNKSEREILLLVLRKFHLRMPG